RSRAMRVTPNGVGTLARWRRTRRPALSAPTFFSGGEAVIDKKPCAWKLASDSAWARPWRNRPGPRDRRRIAGAPDRRAAGSLDFTDAPPASNARRLAAA